MTQSTPTQVPVNLFSPTQMAAIQAEVAERLSQDYVRDNFIPTGKIPPNLFSQVIRALCDGLQRQPDDALFFNSNVVCTIVQISAPTLFVKPGLAARTDRRMDTMLRAAAKLDELVIMHTQRYATPTGQIPCEQDIPPEMMLSDKALKHACLTYAQAAYDVLRPLGRARYPVSPENFLGYEGSALISHALEETPSLVDRSAYSLYFTVATDNWLGKETYLQPPAILGLDILQLMATLSDNSNALTEPTLAALILKFGYKAIQVSEHVDIAEEHTAAVVETLAPHRKWFSAFVAKHPNWDGAVAVVPATVSVVEECGVHCYPASITDRSDEQMTLSFIDLEYSDRISSTANLCDVLASALADYLIRYDCLPLASLASPGDTIIRCTPDLVQKVRALNALIARTAVPGECNN